MTEQFDAKAEPMRAIRDLIVLGESILSDAAECEILERAQVGFSRLRKLFGDARLAQDCAHGPMIEPGPSVDFATAARRLMEIHGDIVAMRAVILSAIAERE